MSPSAIKKIRVKFKLSQAALAEIVGVNQSTLQRWEAGKREVPGPAAKVLLQVASASVVKLERARA